MEEQDNEETNKQLECRICAEEDSCDSLVVPCSCSGTMKYVHKKCLIKWLNYSGKKGETLCDGHATCSICGDPYKVKWNRPHFGQYLLEKSELISWNQFLSKMEEGCQHLLQPCPHILGCWIFRFLCLFFALYIVLFIARLEMSYFLSGSSFDEVKQSIHATMDNILIAMAIVSSHIAIFFIATTGIKLHKSRTHGSDRRHHTLEITALFFIYSMILFGISLPGYYSRFLLKISFGYEWNNLEVNFGTGKNFALHVILSLTTILLHVSFISTARFLFLDFKKYQHSKANMKLL